MCGAVTLRRLAALIALPVILTVIWFTLDYNFMWYPSSAEAKTLSLWTVAILITTTMIWVLRVPLVLWLAPPLLYFMMAQFIDLFELINLFLLAVFSLTCLAAAIVQGVFGSKQGLFRW